MLFRIRFGALQELLRPLVVMVVHHRLQNWIYWWHSTGEHPDQVSSDHVMIELNRDFDIVRLTGKEIQALVMAWQSMAISQETMLHQFERGDVLPPGRSPEEELALIKANPPPKQPVAKMPVDAREGGYG